MVEQDNQLKQIEHKVQPVTDPLWINLVNCHASYSRRNYIRCY